MNARTCACLLVCTHLLECVRLRMVCVCACVRAFVCALARLSLSFVGVWMCRPYMRVYLDGMTTLI